MSEHSQRQISSKKHQRLKSKLGMSYSTARSRLASTLLFNFICETNKNSCFRCHQPMTASDFSIEHKQSWLLSDEPAMMYFDLENVAFSHHKCNCAAAARPHAKNRTPEEYRAFQRKYKRVYNKEKRRAAYLRTGH